jgi:hypothetical protein
MERTATVHDATAQKHDSVAGELWIAVIYEDRRILATSEHSSRIEATEWARQSYGLTAEVR